jgi:hypothetical protein
VVSRLRLVAAAIMTIVAADAFAQKTDVIELLNGDRITCEIKKLERGKVSAKTDGAGTLSIEWDDIKFVTSTAFYDVEFKSGRHVYGSLEPGAVAATVSIVSVSAIDEEFPLGDVVRITPLGRTFWRRLDGTIDGGFSFTEANVQTQWTFHADISYRSQQWFTSVKGESALTYREDADRQLRNTLTTASQRFLRPRTSVVGFAQFQQNDELSLQLRSLVGGGVMRVLTQSNRHEVTVTGALATTNEQYLDDAGSETIAEAVAGVRWEFFTFDGRSTSLDTGALTFYALRADSRFRLELNTAFKSDIVGDLYWSINLFDSFNSNPPDGQKKNDFGVSATIGWTF